MEEMNEMPPVKIAFIIDNEVVDILHTDERLAAIFLSEPKIVDVTGQLLENDGIVKVSSKYDPETNTFYNEDEIN
jgi:hypothetical protein